jgi:hypothetical protein
LQRARFESFLNEYSLTKKTFATAFRVFLNEYSLTKKTCNGRFESF